MIPQQMKKMFGLTNKKDIGMANNIWKMLDEMAENSPDQYKQFIQKNIKEGVQDVKQKKQQKDKPFKVAPEKGFLLEFDVILNEKYIANISQSQTHKISNQLEEKLSISTQKWQDIKKKFKPKHHVLLNVCYSDRVKLPLDKNRKEISNPTIERIKQIQVLYYSIQGPKYPDKGKQQPQQMDYCMIFNRNLYESLMKHGPNGKKMIMSLAISYFEQRLQTDLNPLIKQYNPEVHKKLVFYAVQKLSIQINTDKNYIFNNSTEVQQFLLERQVDVKREKQVKEEQAKVKEKLATEAVKHEIKFKAQQPQQSVLSKSQDQNKTQNNFTQITVNHQQIIQKNKNTQQKKPLIQVLNQTENVDERAEDLPYEMKETDEGYHVEILTPGITSIEELQLQISDFKIKLKILKTSQNVQIAFKTPINSDLAKAKLKKKANRLIVDSPFLSKK